MKHLHDKLMGGILVIVLLLSQSIQTGLAQEVTGPSKIKWIRVGDLHSWFSNSGAEVEYGRRGRACCESQDQTDQMYWEAMYEYQDRSCSRGLWLGCKNFEDQNSGKTYEYKVIAAGPRFANLLTLTMPEKFVMKGKFPHPQVFVDNIPATDNELNDVVDELDESLQSDRLIETVLHTPIGITITRKILGFSQQYHDDYFIYDYVIKNTGIVDLNGTKIERPIEGVVLFFQERYAPGFTAFLGGWAVAGNLSWGSNSVHQVIGTNPLHPDFKYRGWYSWYQPHSQSPGFEEDWGCPDHNGPRVLGAPAFIGGLTIHTDTSPTDQSDDLWQPSTTALADADGRTAGEIDQYNADIMAQQYNFMTLGHDDVTDADRVGDEFGDVANTLNYDQTQGYGPYDLAPGDSIHIVQAEGVTGLTRAKSWEVGTNWYYDNSPFDMPDGSTSNDRNAYKRA